MGVAAYEREDEVATGSWRLEGRNRRIDKEHIVTKNNDGRLRSFKLQRILRFNNLHENFLIVFVSTGRHPENAIDFHRSFTCLYLNLLLHPKALMIGSHKVFESAGVSRSNSPFLMRGNRTLRTFLHIGLMQSNTGTKSTRMSLNPSACMEPCFIPAAFLFVSPYQSLHTLFVGRSLRLQWNSIFHARQAQIYSRT